MSILLPILLLVAFLVKLATMERRDEARVRASLTDMPGEVVEFRIVSLGNAFIKGSPRVYRVIFQLPNGSRLLRRVALHEDGSTERLL